jgi:hypothetical protein
MTAATPVNGRGYTLRWAGAQHRVLAGDLTPAVRLSELAGIPHLYAVGPRAGLRGEVTILDGRALVSTLRAGTMSVSESFDHEACFLVQAQVPRWRSTVIGDALPGMAELARMLPDAARLVGIDVSEPFPFLLAGRADSATVHVLDKRDGLPHNAERHERAKVRFVLAGAVEVIGFHSARHEGIFIPRGSSVHAHLRTADDRCAGHLDALRMAAGWTLALPNPVVMEERP